VQFRDVLDQVERRTTLSPEEPYQLLLAKRSRGGITPREILRGKDILTPIQFHVHEGDFLISRRQIVHGACGLVPPTLHGAIVSHQYAAFTAKPPLLLKFFNYFTHTQYFQQVCFHSSIGVDVEKMVLKLDNWLSTLMCLPPVEEQQRIAALLDSSEALIKVLGSHLEALTARKRAVVEQLLRDVLPSDSCDGSTTLGAVARVITDRADEGNGSICVDLENIAAGAGCLIQRDDKRAPSGKKLRFRENDVLYGRLRPYLHKFWLANQQGSCSGEIWVLRSNCSLLIPRLLFYIVQGSAFARAANVMSGSKMPRADWRLVSRLPIALPNLHRQEEITGYLAACDSEMDLLRRRQESQQKLHDQLIIELTRPVNGL